MGKLAIAEENAAGSPARSTSTKLLRHLLSETPRSGGLSGAECEHVIPMSSRPSPSPGGEFKHADQGVVLVVHPDAFLCQNSALLK